ncbi:translocase of chloroplast 90, chloroplastic [Rutidosis leptorrhynchoides]|uniref:translocase of chloroplast 90, chloroplastic n=1 Tax=Rutidosis leptorrhynchoides TaxID=125765 RepID=UPI003A9986FD
MMSIKDWVLSQLVSNSLASARPLSGSDSLFEGEHPANEFSMQGSAQTTTSPPTESADITRPSVPSQEATHPSPIRQVTIENPHQHHHTNKEKNLDPLAKIERLQIKFLRLLLRLGCPQDDLMVAKVLYRIHLATLIRSGESDLKRVNLSSGQAREIALEQETSGNPELDFSFSILVLGRTGVGKSSTINSILNQPKARTNAFQPATDRVQEIVGTVNGIKISFIDTPGLLPPSPNNIGRNRKILHKIKRRMKKSPSDMVLYFERLDLINTGYSDFPLLKLVTEVFGSEIWFNTMLVMTHSSSPLPEVLTGYHVTYESYCSQRTDLVQHYIHQAVSDSKLENPVLFVENHPECRANSNGDKILPNGQIWRSQFLLSCLCTKILGDVNKILGFHDRIELGVSNNNQIPSLPHLLSSFLRHRISNPNGTENNIDIISLSDLDEDEEDYDKLPPIRILSKSQFKKLTNTQRNDYLDELDYRETLYLKKQLKEELRARKEKESENGNLENNEEPVEPVLLPDMAIPPSFDSQNPIHRYRFLVTSDKWLARPVLDPTGWDHDVGFDGINLESSTKVTNNLYASVAGQVSKDKKDFNVQSECCAAFVDPRGPTYSAALDVQSSDKDLIYTLHGNTKLRVLERNTAECGVSLTSFGKNYYSGLKVEDSFLLGKRLKFVVNGGRMGGREQVAYGGSLQATIRGRDYPVRNDKVSLTMTVLSMNKETVLGGNLESDFRVGRGTNISINANLNNRSMGQLSIKTSSSERLELALVAAVSILRVLLRRMGSDSSIRENPEEVG